MNTTSRYLLTGAGFTKNFGGLLAHEMWSRIFNNARVQALAPIRERLLGDSDFESVYHNVVTGNDVLHKETIIEAVFSAYRQMDDNLREFTFVPGSPYPVNIYRVQNLIAAFAGRRHHPGYVFTVNQDLFIERHYYNGPRPVLPGVNQSTQWFSTHFHSALDASSFVNIATIEELEKLKGIYHKHHELVYLKLHGSCNWHSLEEATQMIVGRDKETQIGRNYLLSWYFDLFRSYLAIPGSRLLVVGYGFTDPHINQVLAESITQHDLTLHILDPTPSTELRQRIGLQHNGDIILSGTRAFYPIALKELFPGNQQETSEWRTIQESFFERKVI